MQHFHVSKEWYDCQCLGFLMCVQMLMYAIAHRGCTNIVRESAEKVELWRRVPCHTRRIEPTSVLPVVFGLKTHTHTKKKKNLKEE